MLGVSLAVSRRCCGNFVSSDCLGGSHREYHCQYPIVFHFVASSAIVIEVAKLGHGTARRMSPSTTTLDTVNPFFSLPQFFDTIVHTVEIPLCFSACSKLEADANDTVGADHLCRRIPSVISRDATGF